MEIEEAASADDLCILHRKVEKLAAHLASTGIETAGLVRTVARLNDRILIRLIGTGTL